MNLINEKYYQTLIERFNHTSKIESDKFINLNMSFFDKALNKSINKFVMLLPSTYPKLNLLYANLYLKVAEYQFYEAKLNPEYSQGNILKENSGKGRKYKIDTIKEDSVTLIELQRDNAKHEISPITLNISSLKKRYTIVQSNIQKQTLSNYQQFFRNYIVEQSYVPTSFSSKSLFINKEKYWKGLHDIGINDSCLKNVIPSTYIDKNGKTHNSINIKEPLFYIAPNFQTAFDFIFKQKIKIDNVVVFNFKPELLQQLIQYQSDFKYRIIGITTHNHENSDWKWLKEEINLINAI